MKKMNTIKNKMLSYYLVIVILMAILSIYTLNMTNNYKQQIDAMFTRHISLSELKDSISKIDQQLVSILSTKSSTSLNAYMIFSDELRTELENYEVPITYKEEDLMLKDIQEMTNEYLVEADLAIAAKRERNVNEYVTRYENVSTIKDYIFQYISDLNIRQLERNANNYLHMSNQIEILQTISIVMIIDAILLSILIVYNLSHKMIQPIIKLSHSAEEIAKGKFDTEAVLLDSDDEISILANAFDKMKTNIKLYIEELKNKAATEAKLKDQQMENLRMQHLLDNARLYALQSQINPHFLFNTINAGVQMAMLEGADRTSEFLESMSRLFRYNIKQIDSEVTLKQEISNVKDYYELLKVRFGDLIQFHFQIEERTLSLKMPPLILQPLIENSYIHGLSSQENGGEIYIKTFYEENQYKIIVEDNGKGMSNNKIKKILSKHCVSQPNHKSTGIGMRNVIDRLELYYKEKDILDIQSEEGKGTKVIISINRQGVASD